jgi:hypothetical protein
MDLRGQAGQEEGPNTLAGAYLAGSAYADIQKIRSAIPNGRVVVCSNGGDIVPALAAFLAGSSAAEIPPRLERAPGGGVRRGGIYTFVLTDSGASVSARPASADFPT